MRISVSLKTRKMFLRIVHKALTASALAACLVSVALAQRPARSNPRPADNKPAANTRATTEQKPTSTSIAADALAVVNGRPITLADLDSNVRGLIENLDKDIAEARRRTFESEVNQLMFEAEAKKRKLSIEDFLSLEIYDRLRAPTQQEVVAVYEANRDVFANQDEESARAQIMAFFRDQQVQKLSNELATKLRMMHVVKLGTDPNNPNLPPQTVLASVGNQQLTAGDFNEIMKPLIFEIRYNAYRAKSNAVEIQIIETLLEAEAKNKNRTADELYQAEVLGKIQTPTDAEIARFYEENKPRIKGDLNSLRADIAKYLQQQSRISLEQALAQRLREGASIQILFKPPDQPVQSIGTSGRPSRGNVNAPVTVVMFTDYQCPACAAAHPLFEDVLRSYGDKVRFVVRDFPLDIHREAAKAAEAANAAHAQGKFFEYIDLLFKNQSSLDVASLKKYASTVGLDQEKFDTALDSGEYQQTVNRDVRDGRLYGVDSTPTFFVNGVRVLELSEKAFREAIDIALTRTQARQN